MARTLLGGPTAGGVFAGRPATFGGPPAATTPDTYAGQASGIIQGGTQAGYFDPRGSQVLRAMLRRAALRTAQNRRRRSSVLGQLVGLSPEQQRYQQVQAEQGASADTSGFLNDAMLQEQLGNQQFARGIYGQERGFEEQRARDKAQRDYEKSQQGGIGSYLGSLAGTGLGAFTGGAGAGLAKRYFH